MARFVNHKLFLKIIIICLCIIKITSGKKVEVIVEKSTRIYGKKKHNSINDPTKKIHTEFSLENRKKFVEKELESFKLKSEININNNKNVEKDEKQNVKQKISTKISNEHKKETNIETKPKEISVDDLKVNSSSTTEEKKNEGSSYYIYGTGIVSIALVGVGFFNVYQRNRNSIFNLTKEELESLDNRKKINNSYTSLSEEERQFLHKINTRKHNNIRRYDELTEDEILEIRKKNGWADSDDGECQLRRRKIDKRLSCNVKINNTNVVAPRRISLNTKLDNDLLSKSSYRRSCDDIKKLKRRSMMPINKDNLVEHSNSYEYLKSSNDNNSKSLSINTKNILIPPIKMVCTIIKNYKPVRPDEIELHLGDKVEIVNIYKDGWATGKIICEDNNNDKNNQKIGYFPLAHASEPEIFDDKINEFIIPSPLTPPVTRSFSNVSYQNSPLINSSSSNSYPSPNINFANSTAVAVASTKSRNRHVSMIALSSSNILTQEPLSIQDNSSNSSVINISNNISIINHNLSDTDNNTQQHININININNNGQNYINNSISISNENTPLINTNTVLSNSKDSLFNLKYRKSTPSIIDPQSITNLLNDVLEEDNKTSGRIASTYSKKKELLPCHSQEVFDFLRGNVYNSKIPMEEREYYKKCLERLRISKIIDMEINQTEEQKIQKKCD